MVVIPSLIILSKPFTGIALCDVTFLFIMRYFRVFYDKILRGRAVIILVVLELIPHSGI